MRPVSDSADSHDKSRTHPSAEVQATSREVVLEVDEADVLLEAVNEGVVYARPIVGAHK